MNHKKSIKAKCVSAPYSPQKYKLLLGFSGLKFFSFLPFYFPYATFIVFSSMYHFSLQINVLFFYECLKEDQWGAGLLDKICTHIFINKCTEWNLFQDSLRIPSLHYITSEIQIKLPLCRFQAERAHSPAQTCTKNETLCSPFLKISTSKKNFLRLITQFCCLWPKWHIRGRVCLTHPSKTTREKLLTSCLSLVFF